MALLHLVVNATSALENNEFSCSVFIDLSKAFDTQGSILGPLLFQIYINHLPNVSNILSSIMFADDIMLFLSHSHFDSLLKNANLGLSAYASWFKLNKIYLNLLKKTTNFIISSGKKVIIWKMFQKILLIALQYDKYHQQHFLELLLIRAWSGKDIRIGFVKKKKKMHETTGIIKRLSHYIAAERLLILYYHLIYPYLSYFNIIWGSIFLTVLQKPLGLQKCFVRIATRSDYHYPSAALFKILQILLFTIVTSFKLIFLSIRFMKVKRIYQYISLITLNQICSFIITQLPRVQHFILLNIRPVECQSQLSLVQKKFEMTFHSW